MTTVSQWQVPTRRSPLEHVHEALGATWSDGVDRWPATYGDATAERAGVVGTAGLAEVGPIDELVVRGPRTPDALKAIGVSPVPRSVVKGERGIVAWCLAEDEVLLLLAPGAAGGPPTSAPQLIADIRGVGAAITDQSSAHSVLRLVGPAAPAILEEACRVDVSPGAVDEGGIVQAGMAGIRVSLARGDHAGVPGYTLLVARDQAEYLWDSLHQLGAGHGLVAVGSDAVGGLPGPRVDRPS